MLSYRHAFHAGNHADVLKHAVLVHLLGYLTQKDKPLWFIDTHAGAAIYALDEGYATKNAEFESGIGRLWAREDLPQPVADYVGQVRALNPAGVLRRYPGSPQLALQLLRKQDRLRMYELHSTESQLLLQYFRDAGPRAIAQAGDGFGGLQAVLPPPSRRALVLIDPSYEDKGDYRRVLAALRDALKRFRAGVYAVWYPQVQRRESRQFPEQLKQLQEKDWLHLTLSVKKPAAGGLGLHGSGMFILNPPWLLPKAMDLALPYLAKVLAQDAAAGFSVERELA
ncbi:MAG: 23S rRNA (adenine(2030)-N(6))-methyltransferase RlmJ [Betaproteobacteria bacterium RIFCSPLOWO2_12_FULL_64_23]|nr:MAG: 23S rRNA (adenine(2030)-N(6))-methyltransferase RlmJ [Betaproteobacteria bacterium RIFCSPLOWO2_12_FULL_64_23]